MYVRMYNTHTHTTPPHIYPTRTCAHTYTRTHVYMCMRIFLGFISTQTMVASICGYVQVFYVQSYLPACMVYVQMCISTHARDLSIYSHACIHANINVYHGVQRFIFACIIKTKVSLSFFFPFVTGTQTFLMTSSHLCVRTRARSLSLFLKITQDMT